MTTTASGPIDLVLAKFAEFGHRAYGESVSLREHMLQTATFAERAGESEALVVACLLHDFGHFVTGMAEDIADHGVDGRHEEVGAAFLSRHFVAAVVEPGRLHVDAKRYLCASDPAYLRALSPASRQSLTLQGGPFTEEQAREFERQPYWREAVRLRHYDEMGKVPNLLTPGLDYYLPLLARFLVNA